MHYFVYLTRDLFTVYVTAPWLGTTVTYAISQSETPWSWQSSAKIFLRDPLLPYSKAWWPHQQPSFPCTSAPSISSHFSLPCLHVPVGRAHMQFPSLLLVKWGRNPASSARTLSYPPPWELHGAHGQSAHLAVTDHHTWTGTFAWLLP